MEILGQTVHEREKGEDLGGLGSIGGGRDRSFGDWTW